MKSFLSVCLASKNEVFHRYIENGIRHEELVPFRPFIGVESPNSDCGVSSLYDVPLQIKQFEDIATYRSWKRENERMVPIHGDIKIETMFTASRYPDRPKVQWDSMHIDNIDIEVYSKGAFMPPDDAHDPISAICIQDIITKTYTVFGWKHYKNTREDVEYIHCDDEIDMLRAFLAWWVDRRTDIITGWNTEGYDVPYIVNRVKKKLGATAVKKLSPVGKLKSKTFRDDFGQERTVFELVGIANYDFMKLYEKFNREPREGNSLEVIARAELGKGKLDYKSGENRTLRELFENDFQQYIDYNILDTTLVGELEERLNFIHLGIMMTYMARGSFIDVFGTVGIWDAYAYNELIARKKLCPPRRINAKEKFLGGWVEDPRRGLHGATMVKDLASSYPNNIIAHNMSPECLLDVSTLPLELRQLSELFKPTLCPITDTWFISEHSFDMDWMHEHVQPLLKKYDVCMTAYGEFFRRDKVGFIPEVVEKIFDERKTVKKEMNKHPEGSPKWASLDAEQFALKTLMNSLFGACTNEWFRYFDIRMGASITSAGQVCVKGPSKMLKDRYDIENLYTDTDSIFLNLQPFVEKRHGQKKLSFAELNDFCMMMDEKILHPCITDFFDQMGDNYNLVKREAISMDFEALADSWLAVKKKRYAMRIINDEGEELFSRETGELGKYKSFWKEDRGEFKAGKIKLKIRGLSLIQSTTPEYAKDKLRKVVEIIFDIQDRDGVIKHFEGWKEGFKQLPFEEASMPRGVNTFNKFVINPKGAGAHVRAGMKHNQLLDKYGISDRYRKIEEGDKIRFAYLKQPNYIGYDVIAMGDRYPKEFEDKCEIDWDIQWDKVFTTQLESIFETIGWSIDTEEKVSIEDFMSM